MMPTAPRLVRMYNEGPPQLRAEGLAWYATAHAAAVDLAVRYGTTDRVAAGVIAALSPRLQWSVNLQAAARALAGEDPGTLRRSAEQASRIIAGEDPLSVLQGPKVRAFYRAIMGDPDAVTLDVWAMRAALGAEPPAKPSPALRARMERAYRRAAAAVGVPPRDFQAAVWAIARGRAA